MCPAHFSHTFKRDTRVVNPFWAYLVMTFQCDFYHFKFRFIALNQQIEKQEKRKKTCGKGNENFLLLRV